MTFFVNMIIIHKWDKYDMTVLLILNMAYFETLEYRLMAIRL